MMQDLHIWSAIWYVRMHYPLIFDLKGSTYGLVMHFSSRHFSSVEQASRRGEKTSFHSDFLGDATRQRYFKVLFKREVVGWAIGEHADISLVVELVVGFMYAFYML